MCALAMPSAAIAQSNRPDPDSPAGVEYELPLDQTREDLSDEGGGGDRGSRDGGSLAGGGRSDAAPLFGAGISPAGSGPPGDGTGVGVRSSTDQAQADDRNRGGAGSGSGASGGSAADESVGPTIAEASADRGGTGLLIPGIALAVLLAGGLIGLALRRGLGQAGHS